MRLLDIMLIDGIGDLASIKEEIDTSVAANATATSEKPATTPDLVYRGGASVTPDLVYRGGASVQPLGAAESPTLTNATAPTPKVPKGAVTPDSADYYVRDPKTGLSQAQVDANKAVADAAKASGKQVVPGDPGEADRVLTPYEKGSNEYAGKTYATAAGAMAAANKAAKKAGPPYDAPAGTHWTLIGTEWKLYKDLVTQTPVTTSTTTTKVTTSTSTSNVTTSDPNLTSIIDSLNKQIAALQGQVTDLKTKPTMVGQTTRRQKNGIVQVVSLFSDGSEQVIDEYKDYSARDAVMKMFENTGLGQTFLDSLMKSIDQVYSDNIAPTDAQILNSIYNSEAYKQRFAANEVIRKRMADGKGRPGDRLLSPSEYVKTEDAYREIMSEAGLPPGFYDEPEDFTNFIATLGTSVAEITERVNIAKQLLNNADENIKNSLASFYGLSQGDMLAYLLDSNRAIDVINSRFNYTTEQARQMYTSAEVGGAATRAGMEAINKTFAEEITKAGKSELAERAFQGAARQQADYERLTSLYGQTSTKEDLAREALGLAGGTEVGIKTKKLASKERAKFQQRSAIDRVSLGSRLKTPDV